MFNVELFTSNILFIEFFLQSDSYYKAVFEPGIPGLKSITRPHYATGFKLLVIVYSNRNRLIVIVITRKLEKVNVKATPSRV